MELTLENSRTTNFQFTGERFTPTARNLKGRLSLRTEATVVPSALGNANNPSAMPRLVAQNHGNRDWLVRTKLREFQFGLINADPRSSG
jgi:hypothetical protein